MRSETANSLPVLFHPVNVEKTPLVNCRPIIVAVSKPEVGSFRCCGVEILTPQGINSTISHFVRYVTTQEHFKSRPGVSYTLAQNSAIDSVQADWTDCEASL